MKDQEKVWLFITRAQPGLHYGHIDWLKQWQEHWINKWIIGVGSSNKEWTAENPFTYEERKKMIEKSVKSLWDTMNVEICPVPDFWDMNLWMNHILKYLPDFDYVVSWNPWVLESMKKSGKTPIQLEVRKLVKGSTIREMIVRKWDLSEYLPEEVIKYLDEIDAAWRLKKIFNQERKCPGLTVDIVCFDKNWKLILIQRKNPPYWVALPWWFVDVWETLVTAAKREMREETSVDVKIEKSDYLGYRDEPDRDPRAHAISHAFKAEIMSWEPKAADDAKSLVMVDPSEIDNLDFAFSDHKEMILKALSMK